jgi:hypothetical protein
VNQRVDPYWSLWGRLKSLSREEARLARQIEAALEDDGFSAECALENIEYRQEELDRRTPLLPVRRVEVHYDGAALWIGQRKKRVNGDAHAVNALRKLDTNEGYWRAFLATPEEPK